MSRVWGVDLYYTFLNYELYYLQHSPYTYYIPMEENNILIRNIHKTVMEISNEHCELKLNQDRLIQILLKQDRQISTLADAILNLTMSSQGIVEEVRELQDTNK